MNVGAITSCNTMHPNSTEGTIPVLLEDGKDDFTNKTKVMSKKTIEQINALPSQNLIVTVNPLPENYEKEKYKSTYFIPIEFCFECNQENCVCPLDDVECFQCDATGCKYRTENQKDFDSHKLLCHQIGMPNDKKRKWGEVAGLEDYYKSLSKKRFTSILEPDTDYKPPTRKPKLEPVLLDFLKDPQLKSYLKN